MSMTFYKMFKKTVKGFFLSERLLWRPTNWQRYPRWLYGGTWCCPWLIPTYSMMHSHRHPYKKKNGLFLGRWIRFRWTVELWKDCSTFKKSLPLKNSRKLLLVDQLIPHKNIILSELYKVEQVHKIWTKTFNHIAPYRIIMTRVNWADATVKLSVL